MNDLTILVNSSDGFEDCWAPFFPALFASCSRGTGHSAPIRSC